MAAAPFLLRLLGSNRDGGATDAADADMVAMKKLMASMDEGLKNLPPTASGEDRAKFVEGFVARHPQLSGYGSAVAEHFRNPGGHTSVMAGDYHLGPKGNAVLDMPAAYASKFSSLPPGKMITFNYDQVKFPDGTTFNAGSGMAKAGVNDPSHSNQSWAGSIPPGVYKLVVNDNGHLGSNYFLQPVGATNTFGRGGFCNHQALCQSVKQDGKVVPQSHGCIVLTGEQFQAYYQHVKATGAQYMAVGTQKQLDALAVANHTAAPVAAAAAPPKTEKPEAHTAAGAKVAVVTAKPAPSV